MNKIKSVFMCVRVCVCIDVLVTEQAEEEEEEEEEVKMERSDERKKAKWELSGGEHRDNVSEFFSTLSAKSTLTKCCSVCMHGWIKRESLFFCKTSNNISSQQINRNEFLIQFRWNHLHCRQPPPQLLNTTSLSHSFHRRNFFLIGCLFAR